MTPEPDRVPLTDGAQAVEAFFAAMGVIATVTDRCPDRSCPICSDSWAHAA